MRNEQPLAPQQTPPVKAGIRAKEQRVLRKVDCLLQVWQKPLSDCAFKYSEN
jgi:hypothetical protein